jgi:S1-C subfamily serine protease
MFQSSWQWPGFVWWPFWCWRFPPLMANAQRLPETRSEIDLTFAPLVKEVSPAVVNVFTQKTVKTGVTPMEMLLYGRAAPQSRVQNSLGPE